VPWKPAQPGERPTLGWAVLDWISEMLAAPDRAGYEPFIPTREQARFVLAFYEVHPLTGKRRVRRGVLSRSRGWGKSPFLAAMACAEALAPVVGAGWDAAGQPVGRPWDTIRTPLVQIAAVSEQQTRNSWSPLLEMLSMGPVVDAYPGLEVMGSFVNLPRGRIEPITSSAHTVKGNRAVLAIMDQTEEWTRSNGGIHLADNMLDNATKIGGSVIESPNAYTPGYDSVAERTANAYRLMQEGRSRLDDGILWDHREAPGDTDMTDRESLMRGLEFAYGDSAQSAGGWVDLDLIIARIWDPDMDAQLARADFLNQITHASDSWLSSPEWSARLDVSKVIADRDMVVLGFDGSRKRSDTTTDATAIIGTRVVDGHQFEVDVWEQPKDERGWQVPTAQVDAAIRSAFSRFNVVGVYADPALWESWISKWEAEYGSQLLVTSTRDHPMEWWMTGGRRIKVSQMLAQYHSAVVDGEMTHDGSSALTRHVLNARRRISAGQLTVAKDFRESPRKIDAAIAAALSWQCRLDAVAAGLGRPSRSFVPFKVR